MLIKSASSTELGRVANALKGKNLIHSDLEQLENSNQFSRNRSEPQVGFLICQGRGPISQTFQREVAGLLVRWALRGQRWAGLFALFTHN